MHVWYSNVQVYITVWRFHIYTSIRPWLQKYVGALPFLQSMFYVPILHMNPQLLAGIQTRNYGSFNTIFAAAYSFIQHRYEFSFKCNAR